MRFKTASLEAELQRCDWRLQILVAVADRITRELGYGFLVTDVERNVAETRRLYEDAHLTPPKGAGVHDVRPCRGADGRPEVIEGLTPKLPYGNAGLELERRLNGLFAYPRGKKAALWHDVAGAHLHLQVPWDDLVLRPGRALA